MYIFLSVSGILLQYLRLYRLEQFVLAVDGLFAEFARHWQQARMLLVHSVLVCYPLFGLVIVSVLTFTVNIADAFHCQFHVSVLTVGIEYVTHLGPVEREECGGEHQPFLHCGSYLVLLLVHQSHFAAFELVLFLCQLRHYAQHLVVNLLRVFARNVYVASPLHLAVHLRHSSSGKINVVVLVVSLFLFGFFLRFCCIVRLFYNYRSAP